MDRQLNGLKTIYGIKFLPPAILIVLITLGGNMVLEDAVDQYQRQRMELALVYQMGAIRARLEKDINNSLIIIHGVEGYISMNPDITREGFKILARRMMHHPNLINNMAAVPDFIITYMYPEAGNEPAIGVDYRDIPAQWLLARKARDTKELVLAGPVDLLQGGTGFIGHTPVFVETPDGKEFWGLVSAVIREDRLYQHVGLDEEISGLHIAIRGRDGLGAQGDIFHGDPSLFDPPSRAVLMSVSLPNGSFQMAGIPKGGWRTEHPYTWAIRISSAIAAGLALLYILSRLRASERRRQADREIREAQQHTFKILESTTDAFFEVDARFNLTYINRRAEEGIGLNKSLHIGKNLWDILDGVAGTRFHDECLRALREQEVVSLEEHYPPLNKWYQMYAYPTPASLSVYFHDITESRQMALEREAFFQLSLDMIVIAGFDGYFKELNPSWERVLGWSRETLLAHPWLDFVHPDDVQSTIDAGRVLTTGQAVVSFENRYKCKDGSWRWMSWNSFPVPERQQIFAVVRDVTETIKARKILQQDRDELETRVEERTIALAEANRKLRRAKEEAEAANRAKTDFLANVSHELRTPLNPIIGLTDYLQETPLEDEQRRFIVDIRDSAGRLLKIINNLIELTMIDSQGLELDLQPFSLAQMLKALVKETEPAAKARGLTVEARIGPDTPELVESNSRQIRRVLTLLLENAIKFTEQGRITLAVDLDLDNTGWTGLHFTVTDTGIGIPPEKVDSLFEDLTQVDTSTTRKYGGLGLGLSLARRIVSKMGGKIWVELPEEGGSRFHVILPFGECCHL